MINDSLYNDLQGRIYILEKSIDRDSNFKSLTANTIQDLQNRMTAIENNNDSFSKSDYISGLSFLLSLLTALCLVGYYFFNLYRQRQNKFRKFLNGKWTTEGDVSMSQPKPFLNFELETDIEDGEITGVFHTNNNAFPIVLSINGNLKYKIAQIKITHFSSGKLIPYGNVKLTIKGKLLLWETLSGDNSLFPKSVIAWKE